MFNGLRVGMSIAKGLAFSASLPLIGVPTLDAVAQPHDACGLPIVAVLQAGRGRLIWSKYWAGTSSEPRNGTASELAQEIVQAGEMVLLCGEVSQEVRVEVAQSLHARIGWPLSGMRRAACVAYLGWLRFRLGRVDDSVALEPTYLHAASPISKP